MTHTPTPRREPRTETLGGVLDWAHKAHAEDVADPAMACESWPCRVIRRTSSLAIETEARALALSEPLDVERLAKALHADAESIESDPTDWSDCPDQNGHREYATFLATEYARLARRDNA